MILCASYGGTTRAQDIAEYPGMLAVILELVVGGIRLVGSNANNAFSSVAQFDSMTLPK